MRARRKILLAYINETSCNSNEHVCMEVESAKMFDEIIVSSDKDMPNCVQNPPCHSKRAVTILDVMNRMDDNDILVYSESTVPDKKELKTLLKVAAKNSAVFFFHGDAMNGITEMLMHDFYYKAKLLPFCQFDGKLFLLRKSSQYIIEEWRDRIAYQEANSEQPINEYTILSSTIYSHLDDNKITLLFED